MGRLLDQLHEDTHAWAAKGHKANRARQRRMMMAFVGHAEALGAPFFGDWFLGYDKL